MAKKKRSDATLPESEVEAEPVPAAERLRAFEHKLFGENHPRVNDELERGIGSPFSRLQKQHRDHHAALEALIAAEAEHKAASDAEAAAHAKLEAAIERAAQTEEASNG